MDGRELEREHRYRYGRRPRVTFGLAAAVLLVHFIQLGTGAISQNILGGDPFELIRLRSECSLHASRRRLGAGGHSDLHARWVGSSHYERDRSPCTRRDR